MDFHPSTPLKNDEQDKSQKGIYCWPSSLTISGKYLDCFLHSSLLSLTLIYAEHDRCCGYVKKSNLIMPLLTQNLPISSRLIHDKSHCSYYVHNTLDQRQLLKLLVVKALLLIIFYFHSESENHSVVSSCLRPHGVQSPWNSPGHNTGVGSLFLHQGIFPTQGSNPGLLHYR